MDISLNGGRVDLLRTFHMRAAAQVDEFVVLIEEISGFSFSGLPYSSSPPFSRPSINSSL